MKNGKITACVFATLPDDPGHILAAADKTVELLGPGEIALDSKLFRLELALETARPVSGQAYAKEIRVFFKYPLADGGTFECEDVSTERSLMVNGMIYRKSWLSLDTIGESWLGWGKSLAGLVDVLDVYVVIMASERETEMKTVGVEEWLNGEAGPWQGRIAATGDGVRFGSGVASNVPRPEKDASVFEHAVGHLGLPLSLALAAAGMLAASLPRPRWRIPGFVVTSLCALAFLALLDWRAVNFATSILKDPARPVEERVQAAAKACGSFFWRDTVARAMDSVIGNPLTTSAIRDPLQVLRKEVLP